MVARIGGEEFAVAAVVDSTQQGYLLAEKSATGWSRNPFGLGQNPIHLTISMGAGDARGGARSHHGAV